MTVEQLLVAPEFDRSSFRDQSKKALAFVSDLDIESYNGLSISINGFRTGLEYYGRCETLKF